jgi:hypothetical protein
MKIISTPDRTERALVHLRFNEAFITDEAAVYSIFYSRAFNSIDAEYIAEGKCFKQPLHIFIAAVPPAGERLTFVCIGKQTQYSQVTKLIEPGINEMWLIGMEEPSRAYERP